MSPEFSILFSQEHQLPLAQQKMRTSVDWIVWMEQFHVDSRWLLTMTETHYRCTHLISEWTCISLIYRIACRSSRRYILLSRSWCTPINQAKTVNLELTYFSTPNTVHVCKSLAVDWLVLSNECQQSGSLPVLWRVDNALRASWLQIADYDASWCGLRGFWFL